jgi:hypothetical protein
MAARVASIDAFHQAMVVGAALLAAGALVSWVGLRRTGHTDATTTSPATEPPAGA